jgi:hypothetical protein
MALDKQAFASIGLISLTEMSIRDQAPPVVATHERTFQRCLLDLACQF